jgi:hypothetical protein
VHTVRPINGRGAPQAINLEADPRTPHSGLA